MADFAKVVLVVAIGLGIIIASGIAAFGQGLGASSGSQGAEMPPNPSFFDSEIEVNIASIKCTVNFNGPFGNFEAVVAGGESILAPGGVQLK